MDRSYFLERRHVWGTEWDTKNNEYSANRETRDENVVNILLAAGRERTRIREEEAQKKMELTATRLTHTRFARRVKNEKEDSCSARFCEKREKRNGGFLQCMRNVR